MIKSYVEQFYYLMKLGREFELRAKEEYMKGNIGGFLHLAIGEEAVHVGATLGFGKGDIFVHYREHIYALARGIPAKEVMAELFGKKTGVSKGKGGSMHLYHPKYNFYGGIAIVGAQIPHAIGAAYARKLMGHTEGVLVAFGDGSTNAGNFYESLNLANVYKVPVIFLCENNYYAIGTRIDRVSAFKDLYLKAKDYMPSVQIDGMDIFQVFEAVSKAKEYVDTEGKPYFIEALTYRYEPHSMSDGGDYRSPREMKIAKEKDPIENLKRKGLEKGLLTSEFIQKIDKKVQQEIEEAVEYALNSPEPDIEELYKDVYCEVCEDVVS
ncbi:MAG: pyruvate dehydrogenase [Aquificota bacterium]|nr:MAG: pyruvate dehydrogenase [Aquificota bacterium]